MSFVYSLLKCKKMTEHTFFFEICHDGIMVDTKREDESVHPTITEAMAEFSESIKIGSKEYFLHSSSKKVHFN